MKRAAHHQLFRIAASLLAATVVVAAVPALAATCDRVVPTLRPNWTVSGAWTGQGDALYLVDSGGYQVLQYSSTGDALGPVSGAATDLLGDFRPTILKSHTPGMLLEMFHGRLIQLDEQFVPTGPLRTIVTDGSSGEDVGAGPSLERMWLWEPAAGDLISCADVKEPSGLAGSRVEWRIAFVRIPLSNPAGFQVLGTAANQDGWDFQDPINVFCRLGLPYIATIGDTAYVLAMEESPGIYRNERGLAVLEPLKAKPASLDRRPELKVLPKRDDFKELMRGVELATMPAGLFAWKDYLYLLNRKPAGFAGTEWSISKIDPREDRVIGTALLATHAHHLTVVPGPQVWAFVEKSSVEKGVAGKLGTQAVESLFFVPSSAFDALEDGVPLCN